MAWGGAEQPVELLFGVGKFSGWLLPQECTVKMWDAHCLKTPVVPQFSDDAVWCWLLLN